MSAVEKVFKLLQYIHENRDREIDPYNENLQELIGVTQKQLGRYLQDLSQTYDNIKATKRGKKQVYKLIKPIDIIHEGFANSIELGMLFEMAKEQMPEVLEDWNKFTTAKKEPYLFFNMPYEDIETLQKSGHFNILKEAIVQQNYANIWVDGNQYSVVKPFKLVFSDGNWYIAFIEGKELNVRRVNFIEKLEILPEHYKIQNYEKYIEWFKANYQNSFSQYNQQPQKAILLANPNIGRYFKRGIKKHFPSKEVIEEYSDGSVKFSIEYTHSMVILPFIQKWLPDIAILEPKELQTELKKRLVLALEALHSAF